MLCSEKNRILSQGITFIAMGILVMLVTTFILYEHASTSVVATFFTVLMEPAGWFFFWEGLNQSIFRVRDIKPNVLFYKKMHTSSIDFFGVK